MEILRLSKLLVDRIIKTKFLSKKEIPVRSVYGDEKSGIKMMHFFITVSLMMLLMHHRRCFSMLISRSVAPHTILAFIAYIIGWIAIIPGLSTDLEDEITNSLFSKFMLLLACWTCAHILDRLAVESRTELRKKCAGMIKGKVREKPMSGIY